MNEFDQELKLCFLEEAEQLLESAQNDCLTLASGNRSSELLNRIFRMAHTFKGSANAAGFLSMSELGHCFESFLEVLLADKIKVTPDVSKVMIATVDAFHAMVAGCKKDFSFQLPNLKEIMAQLENLTTEHGGQLAAPDLPPPPAQEPDPERPSNTQITSTDDVIRISAGKLDRLIDMIGELKVYRQAIIAGGREGATHWGAEYIDKILSEVHDLSIALRMTPIRPVFHKMQRVIWDFGPSLGKNLRLVTEGEDVELDKMIVDKLGDILIHIIRNAIDHGIESPKVRKEKGKPEIGTISIRAHLQENQVQVSISDDGQGLDKTAILAKAIEKGLTGKNETPKDSEIYKYIFEPGFSTKSEITLLSGRGVGMDVALELIHEIGGSIDIRTEPSKGTEFLISLPLILSVIQGLVVELEAQKYIIPLSQIIETVNLNTEVLGKSPSAQPVLDLRGEIIPIVNLGTLLKGTGRKIPNRIGRSPERFGIVAGTKGGRIAFEVESLVNHQPLALKPLGPEIQIFPGIVAGTILNDGEPALVLNLNQLIPARSVA